MLCLLFCHSTLASIPMFFQLSKGQEQAVEPEGYCTYQYVFNSYHYIADREAGNAIYMDMF